MKSDYIDVPVSKVDAALVRVDCITKVIPYEWDQPDEYKSIIHMADGSQVWSVETVAELKRRIFKYEL